MWMPVCAVLAYAVLTGGVRRAARRYLRRRGHPSV